MCTLEILQSPMTAHEGQLTAAMKLGTLNCALHRVGTDIAAWAQTHQIHRLRIARLKQARSFLFLPELRSSLLADEVEKCEVGINNDTLQHKKNEEAGHGETPVEPVSDFPPVNPSTL